MKKAVRIATLLIIALAAGPSSHARDGGQYIYDSSGTLIEINRTVPPGEPPVQQGQPKLAPAWTRTPQGDGVMMADQNGQNAKVKILDDGALVIGTKAGLREKPGVPYTLQRQTGPESWLDMVPEGELQVKSLMLSGGEGIEGSWRLIVVGDDLSIERMESGIWTPKHLITP